MIHEYFCDTGASEAVQGLSDLFSVPYRMMTFKISTQNGFKLYHKQVKYLQKRSWKVHTSHNHRILFSVRLYWLSMNKRMFEITNLQTTPD